MFGKLRIVASADIGKFGPKDSDETVYEWKRYYGAPSMMLWVVLALAILLVNANWNPRALLILVPLLIEILLWSVLKKIHLFPSHLHIMRLEQMFYSLAVGLTVLWLLSHWLGNLNRFAAFLIALVIMVVVGFTGAVSYVESSVETTTSIMLPTIISTILASIVLLGFVLTSWWCRKSYKGWRFTMWLGVWITVTSIAACLSSIAVMLVGVFISISGNITIDLLPVMRLASISGFITGVCVYMVVLPYMILTLCSSFYRQRFYACLHLKSMPTTGMVDLSASTP